MLEINVKGEGLSKPYMGLFNILQVNLTEAWEWGLKKYKTRSHTEAVTSVWLVKDASTSVAWCHISFNAFHIEDCKMLLSVVAFLAGSLPLAQWHSLKLKSHLLHSSRVCKCSLCGNFKIKHLIVLRPSPILFFLMKNAFSFVHFKVM